MSTIRVKTLSSKKHHQLSAGTETKVKFIFRKSIIYIFEYSSNLFVGANVFVPAYSYVTSTNGETLELNQNQIQGVLNLTVARLIHTEIGPCVQRLGLR